MKDIEILAVEGNYARLLRENDVRETNVAGTQHRFKKALLKENKKIALILKSKIFII